MHIWTWKKVQLLLGHGPGTFSWMRWLLNKRHSLTVLICRALKEKFQNVSKFATFVCKLHRRTDEENQKTSWYAEIAATKVHNICVFPLYMYIKILFHYLPVLFCVCFFLLMLVYAFLFFQHTQVVWITHQSLYTGSHLTQVPGSVSTVKPALYVMTVEIR